MDKDKTKDTWTETCKKHISVYFGVPRRGIHSIRLGDIAVLDVLGAIFLAGGFQFLTGYSFVVSVLLIFALSQCVHRILGVRTTLTKWIDQGIERVYEKNGNTGGVFWEWM